MTRVDSAAEPLRSAWLLVIVVMAVEACESLPSEPVLDEPTVVGSITTVDISQAQFRILVEEDAAIHEPLESGGTKIWFTISENTAVFDARGASVRRGSEADLRVGLWVEAVTHGILLDSYPQQAMADTVVILR